MLFICLPVPVVIIAVLILIKRGAHISLRFFLYKQSLKKKSVLTDIQRLICKNYKEIKKLPKTVLISCMEDRVDYDTFLTMLSAADKKDECLFEVCNIITTKRASLLVAKEQLILYKNGHISTGRLCITGEVKAVRHYINKSEIYYELDEKIFKAKICAQNGGITISKAQVTGLADFSMRGDDLFMSSGPSLNVFAQITEFITERDIFLKAFAQVSYCALYGEAYDFERLSFKKVLSVPICNHFIKSYRLVYADRNAAVYGALTALFSKFGLDVILCLPKCLSLSAKPNLFAVSGAVGIGPTVSQKYADYIFTEKINFSDQSIGYVYSSLSSVYHTALHSPFSQTDSFKLLILSLCADKPVAEKLLYKAFNQQSLDGNMVRFSSSNFSILDNNNYFSMLFPLFLSCFLRKHNDISFLCKKLKYVILKPIKKNCGAVFGVSEKIYPADTVYEHAVKCFECFEFKEKLLLTDDKTHIADFVSGNKKYKNIITTAIYLCCVRAFSDYFCENDRKRFLPFFAICAEKIKDILSVYTSAAIPKGQKLMLFAAAEGIFCDRQFSAAYDFADFYDFFEYFSVASDGLRELDSELIMFFILGHLFENNLNTVYDFVWQLCTIMRECEEGAIKAQIKHDGNKFYFCGEPKENLNLLFYSLLRERLSAVQVFEQRVVLGNLFEKLDGNQISLHSGGSSVKLFFKKSGKNKVSSRGLGHVNLKSFNLSDLNGESVTVEF